MQARIIGRMRRIVAVGVAALATLLMARGSPAEPARYTVALFAPAGPAPVLGSVRLTVKGGDRPAWGGDLLLAEVGAAGLAAIEKNGPKGAARLVYAALGGKIFTQRDARAEAASLASGGVGPPGLYYLFAYLDAAPGREAAFNAFYDSKHLPDMLAVPGMVWALRARAVPAESEGAGPSYLALYQFRSYDPAATMAEIDRRLAAGIVRALPDDVVGPSRLIFYAAPQAR